MPEIGVLFIVSTPIGNLEDITLRALRILKEVSLIAAEDTRLTRKLLTHYNISTSTVSYYEHNRFARIPKIIDHLNTGKDVAVVTDAGTPGISDPAYKLIRAAIESGSRIEAIPGPSASITALTRLSAIEATVIFYESPKRIVRTLKDILEFMGDRPAVIGRELTKLHEEMIRGNVSKLLSHFTQKTPRGEFVIMIGKDDPNVYF